MDLHGAALHFIAHAVPTVSFTHQLVKLLSKSPMCRGLHHSNNGLPLPEVCS